MPIYNVTVEDFSPLIRYGAGWIEGSLAGEPQLSAYSASRVHNTNQPGASATFTFYGTACYYYNAKRDNHGSTIVTIDDSEPDIISGFSSGEQFQQLIYSTANLPLGNHTLTIANGGADGLYAGIDFLMFTTGDSTMNAIDNSTFDDTDTSRISYSGDDWSLQNSASGSNLAALQYHNNTFHTTTKGSAQVTIKFEGNAVYVFGGTGTSHGSYSVAVDGGPAESYSGMTLVQENFQVLLYYNGDLPSGEHSLVLTNLEAGHSLDIDFVSAIDFGGTPPSSTSTRPHHDNNKTAIISGGIAGSMCILLVWAMGFWLYRRRRRMRRDSHAPVVSPFSEFATNPQPVTLQLPHQNNNSPFGNGNGTKHNAREPNQIRHHDQNAGSSELYPSTYTYTYGSGSTSRGSEPALSPESPGQRPTPSQMRTWDPPRNWNTASDLEYGELDLPPNYQQATEPLGSPRRRPSLAAGTPHR